MTSEKFIVWLYIFIQRAKPCQENKEYIYNWINLLAEQGDLRCDSKSKTSTHKFCHAILAHYLEGLVMFGFKWQVKFCFWWVLRITTLKISGDYWPWRNTYGEKKKSPIKCKTCELVHYGKETGQANKQINNQMMQLLHSKWTNQKNLQIILISLVMRNFKKDNKNSELSTIRSKVELT